MKYATTWVERDGDLWKVKARPSTGAVWTYLGHVVSHELGIALAKTWKELS